MSFKFIFLIFFIIICLVRIYNYNYTKKVKSISTNYKKALEINNLYYFDSFIKKNRKITFRANSLNNFRKLSGEDVLLYNIKNNVDSICEDIDTAINNLERYKNYIKDYSKINYSIDIEKISNLKLNEDKVKEIESKLLKKIMIKNVYDISSIVYVCYTSPKGKNSYEKKFEYNADEMIECYKCFMDNHNKKTNIQLERLKMTDSLRYDVLKRDNYKCCICGMSAKDGVKLHVDHIIPVSKGGKTEINNLQTLCERCNMGKSDKI